MRRIKVVGHGGSARDIEILDAETGEPLKNCTRLTIVVDRSEADAIRGDMTTFVCLTELAGEFEAQVDEKRTAYLVRLLQPDGTRETVFAEEVYGERGTYRRVTDA